MGFGIQLQSPPGLKLAGRYAPVGRNAPSYEFVEKYHRETSENRQGVDKLHVCATYLITVFPYACDEVNLRQFAVFRG